MSKIQTAVKAGGSTVELRSKGLTAADGPELQTLLENNKGILHLDLTNNEIDAAGAEHISLGLQVNTTLRTLKLGGNKIGSKGGLSIASALQINNSLEYLDLGDTDQDIASIIAITTVLSANAAVRTLVLDRPLLPSGQEESAVHLARMLGLNSSLRSLSLRKFGFADAAAACLSEGLQRNTSLLTLDLSCNKISRDGAARLAHALSQGACITHLSLDSNAIDDAGMTSLAAVLPKSRVQFLGLAHNSIRGAGMDAFSLALSLSPSLKGFRVWGNPAIAGAQLSTDACARLRKAMEARPDVSNVDVRTYEVDGRTLVAYGS